jgi:DNA-binding transcriptional ArsR family regulator
MVERVNQRSDVSDLAAAKLAQIVNNSWRSRILAELCRREMSPSQFVVEVGGELSTISRHFRWLEESNSIELAKEARGVGRRGAPERFFRTSQPNRFDSPAWASLPQERREVWTRNAVAVYFRRVIEAVGAGTFDWEGDRHFSWDVVTLDRRAWTEVTERLDETLDWLVQLSRESERRLAEAGGEAILTTVGLSAFLSPPPPTSDPEGKE